MSDKAARRALMIAKDQRALLRRVANIYPGAGGGMDPGPGGGGYAGPGGGKYIGPSRVPRADGGPIDAYHGSPHDFDKFDFSKIGTGEGAQAFGHGLYIAENPAVADSYRQVANAWATDEANGVSNAQSNYMYFRKAHKVPNKKTGRWETRPAQSHEQAIKSVYDDLTETPEKAHIHRHTLNALAEFAKTGKWPMTRQGRLYDVRFHANPEHLIDLDKPTLGEQPPHVQRGIKDAIDMVPDDVREGWAHKGLKDANTRPDAPIFGAMKFAQEQKLAKAGVPGNRYLDNFSRGAGSGTRNHVVFPTDKEILEILRKRADGGSVDPLKAAGYWQDNPAVSRGADDWLKGKQEFAKSDPKLLRGVTTAGTEAVNIPVDMLKGVPGAMDENPVPGTPKYDRLMKEVKKNGWRNDSPILVGVNHKGKPFILEGNHRSAVARAIGQTHIPGEIKWWNGGEEVEGDWHPKRIAPRLKRYERASGGKVPPFKLHSGAAKLIAAKGQAKATPQQYAAMPGIKPDELKHAKFDTLPAKAQPREEVIKHLEANTVPLQETVLRYRGDVEPPKSDDEMISNTLAEQESGPKWQEHTLPGGENYREVLLHLPRTGADLDRQLEDANRKFAAARAAYTQVANRHGHNSPEANEAYKAVDAAREAHAETINRVNTGRTDSEADNYKSTHWGVPNVVAHLRMSDRRGPNGEKVLHVEELQSDWAQQGRKRGFKKDPEEQQRAEKLRDEYHAALPGRVRAEFERRIDAARREGREPNLDMTKQLIEEMDQDPSAAARFLGESDRHLDMLHATGSLHDTDKRLPKGPYVDNTQKWTDLALKRVLHEAAHGGYDKVVFTPGEEQNKRAQGHADHTKYYDEIMPKRLQALAQQHDPKAKVVLGGHALDEHPDAAAMRHYELGIDDWNTLRPEQQEALRASAHGDKTPTAPLHSLDVTPQLRDSIKANGFSQFKRGGAVGDPIADWHWRPVEDVRNELQLDEIPSHVHKFGEFMDETARRASSQGLTPRDLIKAYAITRASIGRRALPVETLRQTFSELPKGLTGRVRPEGAMGHWLHTKMGQRYLDEAEAGRIDEEAIAHAQNAMRRFGKIETEPTALRWAAKNLPGMEGRVSELIARAHRGQSSPEEWRNEMRVPGVAASKAGFLASMLGRGDQPTLDARQIILHTGRPTKEAAPILGRAGAANAAVDRLADRQTQLGFKHDKSMSPFYQHLAHHAIWDKTAGEETTHDDLMQALRGAKNGGRQGLKKGGKAEDLGLIGSHPVMRALIEGLPHEAFLPTKHAEMNDLLRTAGVVRPYDDSQENIEKALKIAQDNYLMHAGIGSGKDPSSYYNIRQPVAARDVSTKIAPLRGRTPKPQVELSWEKFGKIGEGGTAINLAGDRTRIGTLGEINGKKLNWPVHLYGGPEYIREGKKGIVWANNAGIATGLRNTIRKLSQRGPVYGVYSPMSAVSGDQAHHMFDAVMAQIDPGSIAKKDRKAFDDAMRSGAFIMGNTGDVLDARARVAAKMKSWPGIDNPQAASKFALEKLAGVDRKAIIQYLDKKMWTDRGFPHIGMTRAAITDPSVRDVHDNTIGGHVALLNPDQPDRQVSGNPTYPEGIAGEYVGTLPFVQKHYAAPVSTSHLVTTPTARKGKLSHPFSTDHQARSSYRKLYEQNLIPEPIDQRMVDSASEGLEKQKLYGLKKGGVVDRALALTRKVK